MTSSCATRSTFTVFDVLITTGLSAVAVEAALRAGAVTMAGRLVTDPYAPVHRRDRVWLHNKLVRSGVVLVWRTLRLPGYERGIYPHAVVSVVPPSPSPYSATHLSEFVVSFPRPVRVVIRHHNEVCLNAASSVGEARHSCRCPFVPCVPRSVHE